MAAHAPGVARTQPRTARSVDGRARVRALGWRGRSGSRPHRRPGCSATIERHRLDVGGQRPGAGTTERIYHAGQELWFHPGPDRQEPIHTLSAWPETKAATSTDNSDSASNPARRAVSRSLPHKLAIASIVQQTQHLASRCIRQARLGVLARPRSHRCQRVLLGSGRVVQRSTWQVVASASMLGQESGFGLALLSKNRQASRCPSARSSSMSKL